MIPFASQRGGGQDLATHLMNEHDNEYMEVAGLRGALAEDLHGAFAEWEAQASAMTKCKNYLYSLSINPDPAQGPMARELYDDYVARVEAVLGLEGQPRAVVFHIKEDKKGQGREHCHVVWSRIDVQDMKAIHMSYDHDKLMTVTRQFARDHDIELAPGYHSLEDRRRQTYRQLSLYEKSQDDTTGISIDERRAIITDLWQKRDTPASFIKALEYHGYILASGKRPYVLVDIYGHANSLPKLIDDKAANTKAIGNFLGKEFDGENLPSVDDAKELAAQHLQALKDYKKSQARADQIDQLKEHQTRRRAKMEREKAAQAEQHKQERIALETRQRDERGTLRSSYLKETKAIRQQRQENRPRGLAGFLARFTGVELARGKLHKHQDKKRYDAYLNQKQQIQEQQAAERNESQRRQEMQALDLERKRRALEQTEKRELRSLETSFEKQQRINHRARYEQMPTLQLELTPRGRKAALYKAKNRYTSNLSRELQKTREVKAPNPSAQQQILQDDFARAARGVTDRAGETGDSSDRMSSWAQTPERSPKTAPQQVNPAREFNRKSPDNDRGRKQ